MKKGLSLVVLLIMIFSLASCSVVEKPINMPEIWVGGKYPFQLVGCDADYYDDTFSKITGLNIFISNITDNSLDELKPLAELLKNNGIKVSIELGGLYNHEWGQDCGETSADIDLAALDKWAEAGGTVDRIFMDEAIGRVTSESGDGWGSPEYPYLSYTEAGNEMADYISIVRKKYPDIEIYLGTNFPNWGWKGKSDFYKRGEDGMYRGDYYIALTQFLDTVATRGEKIDGVEVDHPYSYYIGENSVDPEIDWTVRVADLEATVKERGLKFNMIINSEGGLKSSAHFYGETIEYIKLYLKNGGNPDTVTVESWYPYPDSTVPESTRGTLFRTVCEVYNYTAEFYLHKEPGNK